MKPARIPKFLSLEQLSLVLVITIGAALLVAGTVLAQAATPSDNEVNAIAKELYCPVCENVPLDVCPTLACEQWRELIRDKLSQGWTEEEIKDYFVEQYGARVLATPPAEGFSWLVYLVPPAAILGGVFILYRALKSWQSSSPDSEGQEEAPEPAEDEYVARLEEELRNR